MNWFQCYTVIESVSVSMTSSLWPLGCVEYVGSY